MSFVLETAVIEIGVAGFAGVMAQLNALKGQAAGAIGGALGGLLAGAGLVATAGVAIHKALEAEESAHKMATALEVTGQNVGQATAKFNELARAISNATTETKGHVRELLTAATNMGLNADEAGQYTKAALGLARVTGKDAKEALDALAKAGEGNTMMLERFSPALAGISDQHLLLAKAQQLASQGMKELSSDSTTTEGKWAKLQKALDGLLVRLGQIFLPIVGAVVDGLSDLVGSFDTSADSATGLGQAVQGMADWIRDAIARIGLWFKQLPIYIQEFWVAAKLRFSQVVDVVTWATDVAVSTFLWVRDNWFNILKDIFHLGTTIFGNLMDNLKTVWDNVWGWITGSDKPAKAFKSLTDGFKSATTELVTRKFGDSATTKAYKKELDDLAQIEVANEAKLAAAQAEGQKKRAEQKKKDAIDVAQIELGELTPNAAPKEKNQKQGSFGDLLSVWRNIQQGALKSDDPQKAILAEQRKHTIAMEKQNKYLQIIAQQKQIAVAG